jgi:hypothetical protein
VRFTAYTANAATVTAYGPEITMSNQKPVITAGTSASRFTGNVPINGIVNKAPSGPACGGSRFNPPRNPNAALLATANNAGDATTNATGTTTTNNAPTTPTATRHNHRLRSDPGSTETPTSATAAAATAIAPGPAAATSTPEVTANPARPAEPHHINRRSCPTRTPAPADPRIGRKPSPNSGLDHTGRNRPPTCRTQPGTIRSARPPTHTPSTFAARRPAPRAHPIAATAPTMIAPCTTATGSPAGTPSTASTATRPANVASGWPCRPWAGPDAERGGPATASPAAATPINA